MIPDPWIKLKSGDAFNLANVIRLESIDGGKSVILHYTGGALTLTVRGQSVDNVLEFIKNRIDSANKALIKGIAEKLRADAAPFSLEEINAAQDHVNGS